MSRIKGTARAVVPVFRGSPELSLNVPVNPIPCPRPRIANRGKFASAYYPSSYLHWRDAVREHLQSQPIPHKFLGPIAVAVTLVVKPPKSSKLTHPKPDVDNYAKSILDSFTKAEGIWEDDYQVVGLLIYKRWARADEQEHFQVDIWEHNEDTRE